MRNALILLLVGLMFFALPREVGFISGVVLSLTFHLFASSIKYIGIAFVGYGIYKIVKDKFGKK